jgi:hypothetical protein
MRVIHIDEENHGRIGTAVSMKAAFQYLVRRKWLTFNTEIQLSDNCVTIGEIFELNGWRKTNEKLVHWTLRLNEKVWDGMFYFSADYIIEED